MALAAAVVLAGCGSDGEESSTTIRTSPNPGPTSPFPVRISYIPDSPYGRSVGESQLQTGVAILVSRAKLLGLNDTSIRATAAGQIVITYSPEDFNDPANSQLPVQGRLYFYDFDANVVGNPSKPIPEIYDAVLKASTREPVDDPDNTAGEQFYLFGSVRNYRGGPTGSRGPLLAKYRDDVPPGATIKTVPPGTVVVLAKPLTNALDRNQFDGDYILRDRPQLDNGDVDRVEANNTPDGKPAVQIWLKRAGRQKLEDMTAQIAGQGRDSKAASGSFAVVLDGQVLSRANVDSSTDANGLDASNGVQLSGDLNDKQVHDLAAVLKSGPLPFRLVPVLQTQVQRGRAANPGQSG